jgi:hypothetical protein
VEAAVREVLPGDARFARAGSLAGLLEAAGFESVHAADHVIECAMTAEEYVVTREVAATGRALRALLPAREWARLRASARDSLAARFPGGLRFTRAFHTGVGTRPD